MCTLWSIRIDWHGGVKGGAACNGRMMRSRIVVSLLISFQLTDSREMGQGWHLITTLIDGQAHHHRVHQSSPGSVTLALQWDNRQTAAAYYNTCNWGDHYFVFHSPVKLLSVSSPWSLPVSHLLSSITRVIAITYKPPKSLIRVIKALEQVAANWEVAAMWLSARHMNIPLVMKRHPEARLSWQTTRPKLYQGGDSWTI